jgi:hypothetical protein
MLIYICSPETRQIHSFYELDEDLSEYLTDGWVEISYNEFQLLLLEGWN